MAYLTIFYAVLAILAANKTFASKILVLLPLDISSHHQFCQPILRELSNRGHELTVLTPIKDTQAPDNMKQILLPKMSLFEAMKDIDESYHIDYFKDEPLNIYTHQTILWNATLKMTEAAMNSQIYQNFLANDKTTFDLVIYEAFFHEAFIVLAAKYNAPFVAISTFGNGHFISQIMGNPYEISYTSHEFLGYSGKFKFLERLKNLFWTMVDLYQRSKYMLPANYEMAKKYSIIPMENLPKINEIERNVSLVLLNSHFSISGARPSVPGVVEVGGVHIDDKQVLPANIKKYMDEAKDGVIYFSFGSIMKSTFVPEHITQMFKEVFAGLKQRVIWKWDDDQKMKDQPQNVMTVKWLPQVALLGHQNLKVFINHGGSLGLQEAVSKGVTVLCLPLYGDQFGNCARAKEFGFGETLPANKLTKEDLESAVKRLIEDETYRTNAKRVSSTYNDRPLSPIDTAMYWIEYVLRHKGASHLSTPARDQYWYEYYSIDVVLTIGLSIYYFIYILNWLFWNVALRKPINRDHLLELREKHKPKAPMKED